MVVNRPKKNQIEQPADPRAQENLLAGSRKETFELTQIN
jgi:hypothetical protein